MASLLELPPPLLIACLQPLNARSIAAAACACRALAAAAGDHALWLHVLARKWDVPRGLLVDARAEFVSRKRCLRVLRSSVLAAAVPTLADVPRAADAARTLLRVACCSQRFERSRAALDRAPALTWLLGAAMAALQLSTAQATGRTPHAAELADARVAIYAALGAVVLRFGELSELHARDGVTALLALHRVTTVLAQRCGGDAAAALSACAALAAAPLFAPVPTPARVPAAGPCPAGARQPHESARARARREAREGAGLHLLSGSWGGRRVCAPEADGGFGGGASQLPPALELSLGLSVRDDGGVSGFGHDGMGSFDVEGTVTRAHAQAPAPLPQLHARLSLRVTYRQCGWLPGPLVERTVPGAAPQHWAGWVWPFGIVGAWAPETPAGTPQWTSGGTFMLWPRQSGGNAGTTQ